MQSLLKRFTTSPQTPFDRVVYRGFLCCQVPTFWEPFLPLFSSEKFDFVVEIGTCQGGTTFFVNDLLKETSQNSKFISVDINGYPWMSFMKEHNVQFVQSDADSEIGEFSKSVGALLSTRGKSLILCDGGSKRKEMQIYSRLMKRGDVIMCHDYAENENDFRTNIKGRVWDWCEVTLDDTNGLQKHEMYEQFRNKVWGCFVK